MRKGRDERQGKVMQDKVRKFRAGKDRIELSLILGIINSTVS